MAEADDERGDHHPAAVVRQDHEAEVGGRRPGRRGGVGLAGDAEPVAERAFDDEREAEGEEQAVERVEAVEARQGEALDDDAEEADEERRQDERRPVADAEIGEQQVADEGAEHVERAVGEVDDAQQAEDDREAEAEHRVERAVDQADEELAEEGLDGDAEDHGHRITPPGLRGAAACGSCSSRRPGSRRSMAPCSIT